MARDASPPRESALRFHALHAGVPALVALVVLGVFETTTLDRRIQDLFYDPVTRTFPIRIDRLVEDRRETLVWGAGTSTLRLLSSSRLGEARIRAFIDSNPHYRGRLLRGIPVLGPADVDDGPIPILIASYPFQREIEDQIRSELGLRNPLIRLYDPDPQPGSGPARV